MQKWMRLAQRDLNGMRHAVGSLKLAKAMEEPIMIMNAKRPWSRIPGVLPKGVDISQFRAKTRDEELVNCLRMVLSIKKGKNLAPVVQERELADLVEIISESPPKFELLEGENEVDALKRLSDVVTKWQVDCIGDVIKARGDAKEMSDALFSLLIGKGTERKRNGAVIREDVAIRHATHATDLLATVFLSEKLALILDEKMIEGLAWVGQIGTENVRRYKNLDSVSRSPGSSMEKRIEAMRKKFEIACPEALEKLRAQSKIVKENRNCRWELPPAEGGGDFTALRGNGRTEIEDVWRLRAEFPGLYKIMVNTSTEGELLGRKLKREARIAMREGVPPEFVNGCFRMGINDAEKIMELYTASGVKERIAHAAEAEKIAEEPEVELKKRNGKYSGAAKREVSKPEERGEKPIVNKGDLLSSIQLSPGARSHIREAELSPKDVLNGMVKGFNMGQKGNAAVGGGHFRGDIIRRNIRRYLRAEYKGRNSEAPGVEEILDYLKSIEVVQEFGSSACTRTKDDAMSINTNPGHEIGKDIITTVNARLIEFRK